MLFEVKNNANLFQDKHGMIKQLLKFFICVVDAELFKWIELKIKEINLNHRAQPLCEY